MLCTRLPYDSDTATLAAYLKRVVFYFEAPLQTIAKHTSEYWHPTLLDVAGYLGEWLCLRVTACLCSFLRGGHAGRNGGPCDISAIPHHRAA